MPEVGPQTWETRHRLGGLQFAVKHWGNPQGPGVLALHGWLDNAASFDFLAPKLLDYHWVCPDLAGHGLSDHRSHVGAYGVWQDVVELFALLDDLAWPAAHWLGHSRGAAIASLAAGACPERVLSLALLDGISPFLAEPDTAPEQLASCIKALRVQRQRPQTCHSTRQSALRVRQEGQFPVSAADVEALAARGLVAVPGGFVWRYDYQLMAPSELRLSAAQFDAFVQRIRAPIRLFAGDRGLVLHQSASRDWLNAHPEVLCCALAGGHHFHMSENAEALAPGLAQFWGSIPS